MATTISELVALAVVIYVLWRFAAPPIRKMMANQQQTVQTQLDESEKARQALAEAERKHADAVEKARLEAAKIREEARADAQRISEQLREQADAEVERIKAQGTEQITLQRQQLIRQLRADLGSEAVAKAGERVRTELSEPEARSASVDRFLDELESMAGAEDSSDAAVSKNSGVS
jgi:F-type H+-transporting ATPase subunit delta